MNDRNRFRVWDNDLNQYITDTFEVAIKNNGELINRKGDPIKNCIVEHCTGLSAAKSYRGTTPEDLLIWESDIVSGLAFHKRGLIVWQNGGFGFMSEATTPLEKGLCNGADWKDFVSFANHNYLNEILGRFEIVGNVHEVSHA